MSERATTTRAEIGVIGGSGFYQLLTDTEQVRIDTPYGEPSDAVSAGTIAGRRVAFIPGTAVTTESLPTRSTIGRTCGRCGPSACVRSWPPARSARCAGISPQGLSSCRTNWWTVPAGVGRRSTT